MNPLTTFIVGRALAVDPNFMLKLPGTITTTTSNAEQIAQGILDLIFAFLAVMAFIGIAYSGVMMITAGGDSAKFAQGRKNLIMAIIGIIVVVLAYFIVKFVFVFVANTIGAKLP